MFLPYADFELISLLAFLYSAMQYCSDLGEARGYEFKGGWGIIDISPLVAYHVDTKSYRLSSRQFRSDGRFFCVTAVWLLHLFSLQGTWTWVSESHIKHVKWWSTDKWAVMSHVHLCPFIVQEYHAKFNGMDIMQLQCIANKIHTAGLCGRLCAGAGAGCGVSNGFFRVGVIAPPVRTGCLIVKSVKSEDTRTTPTHPTGSLFRKFQETRVFFRACFI